MHELKKNEHSDTNWKASPNFLVAISPSPYSQYLIRWTQKTSFEQKASWLAVYIQTVRELSQEENDLLKKNMKLVNDLGAELIISMDDDIPGGIIRVARQHAISHIVIGKPLGYKSGGRFNRINIIDALIRESGEIDVFVISEQNARQPKKQWFFSRLLSNIRSGSMREYIFVTFWLVALIGINLFLHMYISHLAVGFIFLAAVSVISSIYRRGPVLFFASLSAIFWNFLFLQPRFTFYIDHIEDLFMFLMYFITAFIIGNLTTRLRLKELFLRKREKNLRELYLMSKILNESNNQDEIIQKSMDLLKNIFSLKISIFLKDENSNLRTQPCRGSDFVLSEKDREAALWCFANKKPAGGSTDTMNSSPYYYLPFLTQTIPAGVLAIDCRGRGDLSIEQENLLIALLSQITTAIERNEYNKTQQKIQVAEESEKLYQILLNLVSHELRTPITTISTAANGLIDEKLGKDIKVRKIFATDIIEASDRLNRIVDNLLGSLRIESEKITLNLEWYDICELVSMVVNKMGNLLKDHTFLSDVNRNMPMLKFDFNLMEQLLTNLLYNAILYTPAGSQIWLKVEEEENIILLSVNDNGPGIAPGEKEMIFRKFYRSKGVKTGGLGLGLSICKEIAEIHKGAISVETNEQGGARFIVKLPLEQNTIRGEL